MYNRLRFSNCWDFPLYDKGHIINGHEVIEKITETSMSIIYEVLDPKKQRKILKTPRNPKHEIFLFNESKILTDLNQKNISGIIKSYELFTYGKPHFLPLEKLEIEIENYLDKGYYPSMIGIFIDFMSDILTSFKKEGIVHRDIKPGNIMGDKENFLKLFDFGLAVNLVEEGLKDYGGLSSLEELYQQKPSELIKRIKIKDNEIRGTPGYIAPEVFGGILPLSCNDMYSFGKTLARLLLEKCYPDNYYKLFRNTLVADFESAKRMAEYYRTDLIKKIKAEIILPETLEEILETTLSPNPDDRPTPEELKEMNIEYMRKL